MTRLLLALGPSEGGVGRHVRQLYDGFSGRGYDVAVAGPASLARTALRGLGTDFAPLELPGAWRGVSRVARDLAAMCREADLLHVQGLRASTVGIVAARRSGIPCVAELHNLVTRETGGRSWRLTRTVERVVGATATVAIGISPDIVARLGPRGRLVLLGIDAPEPKRSRHEVRAELGVEPDTVLIIAAARLQPQKALHVLVDAGARLAARGVTFETLIVGDGPERTRLEARIARREAHTRLLGRRDDVPDLIAASDIAVLSSAWEGVPLFLHEAAWLGLPLVGTDVGGNSLVVRDAETGLLVPSARPDLLADALDQLARDAFLRERLGENARRMEEFEFSTGAMLSAIEDIYTEVLAHRVAKRDAGRGR